MYNERIGLSIHTIDYPFIIEFIIWCFISVESGLILINLNRMRYLFILLAFASCATPTPMMLNYPLEHKAAYRWSKPPTKFLVLNTFDVKAQRYRANKEELFVRILDSMVLQAAGRIKNAGYESQPVIGLTKADVMNASQKDSLLKMYNASHLVAIDTFDAKFIQTDVEVTRDGDSKSREAYYDFECVTGFQFMNEQGRIAPGKLFRQSYFHSSRMVASGLLAAGPNIVTQQQHGFQAAAINLHRFLDDYFPNRKVVNRPIFIDGLFSEVGAAARINDYEKALEFSRQLTNTSNPQRAAEALYNCAVLSELMGDRINAERYLRESIMTFPLEFAREMVREY